MKILVVRLVGIAVFAVAFFLPAVRGAGTGPGSGPMVGWACAFVAGAATAGLPHLFSQGAMQSKDAAGAVCLILSGWVNPLVLLYLLFSIWRRFVKLRRVLAAAILVCMGATWIFLLKAPMFPLIGHFVWIGGIVLIIGPEAAGIVQGRRDTKR